ncbi:MAG: nickel-dependent lactate racemase [Spirochaetales bacterium]|nr:nickel-dependent lactate racemase [Spirochaetales bacterium]
MKETYILYGEKKISIRVPDSVDILESMDSPEIADIDKEIKQRLENPIGTVSLEQLIRQKTPKTVAVTISDITRAVPNPVFLPHILGLIESCGVERKNISIIVGTGMHRPSTKKEHMYLVGKDIYNNYRIVDHNASDENSLTKISEEPPVSVNSEFIRADFKIVTGFIEPHFMAGYSGGRKGVCPALVDLKTVKEFHGFKTLSSTQASEGILDGNPCHRTALTVAKAAGVDFLFNVTLNRAFRISGIFCGDLEAAHQEGCSHASTHASSLINQPYDLVITNGGGFPLDCNYYQSVKGMCMALPALRKGSSLLQISECREGIGSNAFQELLASCNGNWKKFLKDIEVNKDKTKLDQWEFQMLCRVLEVTGINKLFFLSEGIPYDDQKQLYCSPVEIDGDILKIIEDFIHRYTANHKNAKIAVIPSGPYTILRNAKHLTNRQLFQN